MKGKDEWLCCYGGCVGMCGSEVFAPYIKINWAGLRRSFSFTESVAKDNDRPRLILMGQTLSLSSLINLFLSLPSNRCLIKEWRTKGTNDSPIRRKKRKEKLRLIKELRDNFLYLGSILHVKEGRIDVAKIKEVLFLHGLYLCLRLSSVYLPFLSREKERWGQQQR